MESSTMSRVSAANGKQEQQRLVGGWRDTMGLLLLLLVAAGARSAVMAARWERLTRDPDGYRLIAENLRQHGAYSRWPSPDDLRHEPTAFRPPLYPLLLAACAWRGQVTALSIAQPHLLLGTFSVWLVWLLARRWGLGRWSYLAAIMVACDPILLNQSSEVMTETLATFLAIAALLALTYLSRVLSWKAACLAGGMLGLASLCRPTFFIWMVAVATWAVISWRWWEGGKRAALILVGFFVVLAPWVIRNQQEIGKPILATTHGGYTLLLGNNPLFYSHLRQRGWREVWDARHLQARLKPLTKTEERHARGARMECGIDMGQGGDVHPELIADQRLYELAWQTIQQNPSMFASACLVRVLRFWSPLPHQLSQDEAAGRTLARWCIGCWYVFVFLVALYGLWRLGPRLFVQPWVWGMLCVLSLTAVHTVYWSNMRMRAPVMPVVYLVCALGCAHAVERFCNHEHDRAWA